MLWSTVFNRRLVWILFIFFACQTNAFTQTDEWVAYQSPADAGFDSSQIRKAHDYYDSLGAAGAFVVYKDHVLINWGQNSHRFMCASVRKSFLSALVGIEVTAGHMFLKQTLKDFGVDDRVPLTAAELEATVSDLLTSRSGVYIPAAYEAKSWADRRPARGSHKHGTFWYYNNWDFNVLGHIYEKTVHESIAEAFGKKIAAPLGMEDFRLFDVSNFYIKTGSKYPAYTFKMSARDMARFGLLYLRNGKWNVEQVIPEKWIKESTSSKVLFDDGYGYGFLWWSTSVNGHRVYFAKGTGVQGIYIVPDMDIVFVFRVNTYGRSNIDDGKELRLLSMIMDGKVREEEKTPQLVSIKWEPASKKLNSIPDVSIASKIIGKYEHPQLGSMEVLKNTNGLVLHTNPADFIMYPWTDSTAYVEDLDMVARLKKNKAKQGTVEFGGDKEGSTLIFYIE